MVRFLFSWLVAWLVCGVATTGVMAQTDELSLERLIAALDQLTPPERAQVVPTIADAVAQHPDVYVRGRLSQALDEQLTQLEGSEAVEGTDGQADVNVEGELEGLEAFLERERQPLPTEEEIRRQIAELTLDPVHPEFGLTEAWELAGVIDHVEDPELQAALRRMLEDRVIALQAEL